MRQPRSIYDHKYYMKNKDKLIPKHKISTKKWKSKSENKLKINTKCREWHKKGRLKAEELLGSKCKICGEINPPFELHHLKYESDSQKGRIWQEVLKHPERFWMLCRICHRTLTWSMKDTRKAELVMNIVRTLQKVVN